MMNILTSPVNQKYHVESVNLNKLYFLIYNF